MMSGDIERSVDQLSIAEDLDQFKAGRVHIFVDVGRSDESLYATSDVEECKDGKESTLANTEGSYDKLNAAEREIESGELFSEIMFQLEITK